MRKTALLLAVLFVAPVLVHADDEPVLPLNPFTDAKVGDWESMVFEMQGPGHPLTTHISTWRVKKVDDDKVEVDLETLHPGSPGKPAVLHKTYKRQGTITLREYFAIGESEKLEDVATTDKKFTIEGHTFDGKQISFKRSGGKLVGKDTLLLAAEVKGAGIVAMAVEIPDGGYQQHRVVGYGTAEKKLWGMTAEEVPLVEMKEGEHGVGENLYKDKTYGFSIQCPRFPEIQEHQVSESFSIWGEMSTFCIAIQGDPTPRKTFRENTKKQIKAAGYELVKNEETKVSGKEALAVEYIMPLDLPEGGQTKGRTVNLIIFRDAHIVTIRATAPEKEFKGGDFEKSLRTALSNVRLIDRGGGEDHKNEEAGVYYDHRYGLKVPLPELPQSKTGPQAIVVFQGPIEAHGNTSRVGVSFMPATTKDEFKFPETPGVKVTEKKELEVSGRPALRLELEGEVDGRPIRGIVVAIFDKARTYLVDGVGAKAAWDEEGDAFRDAIKSFQFDK
ncbi:MAG TPA: hypothetical protein VFF73_33745 [Planctomycetota bacterium]|nr:hypothetical protein [Planctomycetota bacterium]